MFTKGESAKFDLLLPGKSSRTPPDHHGMPNDSRLTQGGPVL